MHSEYSSTSPTQLVFGVPYTSKAVSHVRNKLFRFSCEGSRAPEALPPSGLPGHPNLPSVHAQHLCVSLQTPNAGPSVSIMHVRQDRRMAEESLQMQEVEEMLLTLWKPEEASASRAARIPSQLTPA